MQRELRLTGGNRISQIHQEGRGRANRLLVMKVIPNNLDRSRFVFLVGKRIGKAVVRNRLRRRLREAAGLANAKAGWDILFIARRDASGVDYHQLKQATEDLLGRAGLLPARRAPISTHAGQPSSDADGDRPRGSARAAGSVEPPGGLALTPSQRGVEQ